MLLWLKSSEKKSLSNTYNFTLPYYYRFKSNKYINPNIISIINTNDLLQFWYKIVSYLFFLSNKYFRFKLFPCQISVGRNHSMGIKVPSFATTDHYLYVAHCNSDELRRHNQQPSQTQIKVGIGSVLAYFEERKVWCVRKSVPLGSGAAKETNTEGITWRRILVNSCGTSTVSVERGRPQLRGRYVSCPSGRNARR